MAELGFWTVAAENPAHLAVVEPDGTAISAGELLARANQLVHGLRATGLQPGDAVAALLPNSTQFYVCYLACLQAGWYLVPINNHLVGPEIAYILQNCDAKAFIADERYAAASAAADQASLAADRRLAVGKLPGFRPLSEVTDGRPGTTPAHRLTGAVMNYTSGTTGRPK